MPFNLSPLLVILAAHLLLGQPVDPDHKIDIQRQGDVRRLKLLKQISRLTTPNNEGAKIAAHLVPASHKNRCGGVTPEAFPCNPGSNDSPFTVSGSLQTGYDLYLFVVDADSIAAATFAITYNDTAGAGVDADLWTACADGTINQPGWPSSGTGTIVTWILDTNCQSTPAAGDHDYGVTALIGVLYVYAYSDDVLSIVPRRNVPAGFLEVNDCVGRPAVVDSTTGVSSVVFGSGRPYDPCY